MAKNNKKRVELRKNRTKPPRAQSVDARLSGARLCRRGDHRRRTRAGQGGDVAQTNHHAGRADRRARKRRPACPASTRPCVCRAGCCACMGSAASCRPIRAENIAVPCAVCSRAWPPMNAASSPPATACGFGPLCLVKTTQSVRASTGCREILSPRHRVRILPTEGFIERVEPRHGMLTRSSRGREHVIVANVDQFVIVMAVVEPDLKPHLIDRYLASAEQGKIAPILCLNKARPDRPGRVSAADRPVQSARAFRRCSPVRRPGMGIARLRRLLKDRQTVFAGQSGVGKSSLLNALQPGLGLRVRDVSTANQKGRHTTTTAELCSWTSAAGSSTRRAFANSNCGTSSPRKSKAFSPNFALMCRCVAFPDCSHTHENRLRHQAGRPRPVHPREPLPELSGLGLGEAE